MALEWVTAVVSVAAAVVVAAVVVAVVADGTDIFALFDVAVVLVIVVAVVVVVTVWGCLGMGMEVALALRWCSTQECISCVLTVVTPSYC